MKQFFIPIIIAYFATPCASQWKTAGFDNQILAFGVHDSTLFESDAGGVGRFNPNAPPDSHWDNSDNGIDFTQGNISTFASLGRYFYACIGQSQTFRSSDNGSSWQLVGGGHAVGTNGYYLYADYQHFQIGPYMALSRDSGQTWDSVASFPPESIATNGMCIFANTGTAIFRSQDTGNHWSKLSPTFIGGMTTMVSEIFITGGGKVIESTDSGSHWSPVAVDSGGSVPETVNVLVTDGKNLFAGTTKGVYLSMDTGKTWLPENQGLTYLNVDALGVFDTLLFVNTPAAYPLYYTAMRSIPEMTDTSQASVVQQLPPGDTMEIFPNPATGMVTIMAGGTSILGITVLNVLGQNVLALPNLRESEISIDLSKLPSGTYFLEIQSTSGLVVRKIVKE